MVAEPAVTPVTTPEASIVATPVALLLHVPPLVASASVVVADVHTVVVPVIDAGVAGKGLIVTVVATDVLPQLLETV